MRKSARIYIPGEIIPGTRFEFVKEVEKTIDNFVIFLNRQGIIFKKALEELLEENSVGLESQMKNLYV